MKLAAVACAMFAFVFVVMVPLYDVLCDALGINGNLIASTISIQILDFRISVYKTFIRAIELSAINFCVQIGRGLCNDSC